MWIFALLGIGVAFLLGKKSAERKSSFALPAGAPQRALPAGPGEQCPPSPMDVLCEFVKSKQQPPPLVVMCALAQVESMGRQDLAHDIIRLFVLPTVQAHQLAKQGGGPVGPTQGAPAFASSGQPGPGAPASSPSQTPGSGVTADLSDEQIQAMLNADPKNFLSRVQRGEAIDVQPGPEQPVQSDVGHAQQHEPDHEESQVQVSGTVIGSVLALPSPIRNVDSERWSAFTERLARESPSFASARHVGQFRQNRQRLGELGIDPASIVGSVEAQRRALDRDLADAYRHAVDSGMTSEHVNRTITLPGDDAPVRVTMSGVLGVVQAAGLEGAVGWLESYNDRRRFPHTTAAFQRTNGVF